MRAELLQLLQRAPRKHARAGRLGDRHEYRVGSPLLRRRELTAEDGYRSSAMIYELVGILGYLTFGEKVCSARFQKDVKA